MSYNDLKIVKIVTAFYHPFHEDGAVILTLFPDFIGRLLAIHTDRDSLSWDDCGPTLTPTMRNCNSCGPFKDCPMVSSFDAGVRNQC